MCQNQIKRAPLRVRGWRGDRMHTRSQQTLEEPHRRGPGSAAYGRTDTYSKDEAEE